MATQRFEAPTFEEALDEARRTIGDGVRVVSADLVRSGGLAGFFAKERVEVVVEVTGSGAGASGTGESATLAGSAGVAPAGRVEGAADGAPRPGAPVHGVTTSGPVEADDRDDPDDPVDAVMATLDELLSESLSAGPTTVLEMAEQIDERAAPPAGRPAGAAPPAGAAGNGRGPSRPRYAPVGSPDGTAADGAGFAAVLEQIVRSSGPEPAAVPPPAPAVIEAAVAARPSVPALAPKRPLVAKRLAAGSPAAATAEPVAAAVAPPAPAAAVVPAGTVAVAPGAAVVTASLGNTAAAPGGPVVATPLGTIAVRACGLPERLITERVAAARTPAAALREALAGLPPVPAIPTEGGTVVAVVGERRHAAALAAGVCADLGLRADDVVVASARRAGAPASSSPVLTRSTLAEEERRSWRWRNAPTVVFVDAKPDHRPDQWAVSMLAALEPTLCWGVVEATRKPEDIDAWSEGLGGLDALALVEMEATCTPATALGLGIPVAMVDGRAADPDTWFALLEPALPAATR